jgi:hypothetical protein
LCGAGGVFNIRRSTSSSRFWLVSVMDDYPNVSKDDLKALFTSSLGDFINLFSITENMARTLMAKIAGVDAPTALALFSGVRTDQSISNIRRMHQARKVAIDPALDAALQQLTIINGFRNDILHHRVDFNATPPVTTNRATVINEAAVRETTIGPATLLHAGEDLGLIILIFSVFLSDTRDGANLEWAMQQPWKHKPAAQPRKRHQTNGD